MFSPKLCFHQKQSYHQKPCFHQNYVFPKKYIFKASALCADAFYKSKCPSVCPSVGLSVCSLLRYHLTVFLPPLPEVGCPIFLEIRNPWEKVMERSGLRYEHFCLKIAAQKKVFSSLFSVFFGFQSFLMVFCPHFPKSDVQYF